MVLRAHQNTFFIHTPINPSILCLYDLFLFVFYLQSGWSKLVSHEYRPVHQLSHTGIHHLQRVLHQFCHIHLPVRTQHSDHLVCAFTRGCVELGQNLNLGSLVLQRTSSAYFTVIIIIIIAVSGRSEEMSKRSLWVTIDKKFTLESMLS